MMKLSDIPRRSRRAAAPGQARGCLAWALQLREVLAQDLERTARQHHLILEPCCAARRCTARGAVRLPIHDPADLAYTCKAARRDRVWPYLVAALRPQLQ